MRRLALLCLLVAAVSCYNLIVQEFQLTGGGLSDFTCPDIANVNVYGRSIPKYDCYDTMTTTEPPTVETRHIVYQDEYIATKAKSIDCMITLKDSQTIKFTIHPNMKAGQIQGDTGTASYARMTTTAVPTTTETPECYTADQKAKPECATYCAANPKDPDCPKAADPSGKTFVIKAARKTVLKPKPVAPEAPVVTLVSSASADTALPPAIRVRGPGPARLPARLLHPIEDTVVSDEDNEARRIKRDDGGTVDDPTINYKAIYYILDEAGNPAAVWAAVIEGIILLLLVGACFYFFFWAPRRRGAAAASAAADPYKEEGNYSVSYANTGYNQRIDAFGNPAPAAPPRPANSSYMEDYTTDNIGAMSRPTATTTAQPASAVTNSSAAFQPGHQRFDSSGLVTVNLS